MVGLIETLKDHLILIKLFFQSCIPNQLKIYEKVWHYEILPLNALNLHRIILIHKRQQY